MGTVGVVLTEQGKGSDQGEGATQEEERAGQNAQQPLDLLRLAPALAGRAHPERPDASRRPVPHDHLAPALHPSLPALLDRGPHGVGMHDSSVDERRDHRAHRRRAPRKVLAAEADAARLEQERDGLRQADLRR